MTKQRFKPCPTPGCEGKLMTDELHRSFNGKVGGKQVCADCVVQAIYDGMRN